MTTDPSLGSGFTEDTLPKYDPTFGDEKVCVCGHPYYRHFDTYEEMRPVGCKYCSCPTFGAGPFVTESALPVGRTPSGFTEDDAVFVEFLTSKVIEVSSRVAALEPKSNTPEWRGAVTEGRDR